MKHALLVIACLSVTAGPALAADRLTDRDVKALVTRIEDGRDKFDNALDDSVKHKVVRGASGEVNVSHFLNDFQESIDRLEQRLKPDYAASAEVGTLLRQASAIDAFLREQPAGMKGESEWNRLVSDFKTLAAAYGASFPLPDKATVRRMGDGEVMSIVDRIAGSAAQLKKSLDADLKVSPGVDRSTRENIVKEADQWAKDARNLKSRIKDGKPSSAEAEAVLSRAARLQTFIQGQPVPSSSRAWPAVSADLRELATAYNTQWGNSH